MSGIPIDGSGAFTGLERMPAALRIAGLVDRLKIKDLGDLPVKIDDPKRDKTTGIIGFKQVGEVSDTIFNPVLDTPDGYFAKQIVKFLTESLRA